MKRVLFYLVAAGALLACASCAKKNVISGHFDGLTSDSLLVEIMDFNNMREPLSSMVIPAPNGNFSFNVQDTVVRGILIYTPDDIRGREHGIASVLFVPGESAKISGTLQDPVFDGSKFYKDMKTFNELRKEDEDKLSALLEEQRAALAADDEAKADSISELYKEVDERIVATTKEFIKNNPNSMYAATLLGNVIGDDGKDALELLENIPDEVKEGYVKPLVDRYKANAERAKARSEAALKVKDNMAAPDFTLKNEKGEDFALSSLYNKGQYIILDFWGDWCYWCKKGIPDMKKMYADAKGKVEILSIDCGDTEEVWKNSIKENALPWLHVFNPDGTSAGVPLTYAVQGYPTKVILNPDGTINKTIVGEDPEFYTYISELIGKK